MLMARWRAIHPVRKSAVCEQAPTADFVLSVHRLYKRKNSDLPKSYPYYTIKITTLYITFATYNVVISSGPDGSRTRVRRKIPCPSTSVVCYLTFPPHLESKHPRCFSSFIIRPLPQSFDSVVSHIVEAELLKCECFRVDYCQLGSDC